MSPSIVVSSSMVEYVARSVSASRNCICRQVAVAPWERVRRKKQGKDAHEDRTHIVEKKERGKRSCEKIHVVL